VAWYIGLVMIVAAGFNAFNGTKEMLAGEATISQVLGITAVTLVIGVLLLIVPVLRWRQRVICYEHGLVWHRLYGDKTMRVPGSANQPQSPSLNRQRPSVHTTGPGSVELLVQT